MATSILENIKNSFDLEDENSDLVLEVPKKKEELVLPIEEAPECVFKPLQCPVQIPHKEGSIKDSIDTGFDLQSSLDYKPCTPKPLQTPLYKENYLSEFETAEEKRQARHNLGIYDDWDIVEMGLINVGDAIKDKDILDELQIKVVKQGGNPIAVQTLASAVLVKQEQKYTSLQDVLGEYATSINKTHSRIDQLLTKSAEGAAIKTVGDINFFLGGFKNSETLVEVLGDYLKFESKGTIEQQAWKI